MKGDFTRNTFDPGKHFTRVLMQQGRVQLDADWNEQAAILLHYLRALATDLIGPHGGPGDSFKIEQRLDDNEVPIAQDFCIHPGHYYVNGILCENPNGCAYTEQNDYPFEKNQKLENGNYLVYLDVWERHITALEAPGIREVALGGADTATRAQVVWQVKVEQKKEDTPLSNVGTCEGLRDDWEKIVSLLWQFENRGRLSAWANIPKNIDLDNACITPPESRYRGAENQLYRVEIHKGGVAEEATFKWSRDNGSVVFPIRNITTDSTTSTPTVALEHLGRDNRFSLEAGNWVEIVDDDYVLRECNGPLLKVINVDRVDMNVFLEGIHGSLIGKNLEKHPLLRRWDHRSGDPVVSGLQVTNDGVLPIREDTEILLEDGITIYFKSASNGEEEHRYRPGDYWLIPARTATGDVEWPQEENEEGKLVPKALPPHGVEHHYAPLAIISVAPDGTVVVNEEDDCRCSFNFLGCSSGGF